MQVELKFRKERMTTTRKRHRYKQPKQSDTVYLSISSYEQVIKHGDLVCSVYGSPRETEQWNMVEDYCWLYLGKQDDAWDRYDPGRVPHASMHKIGVSTTDALTDEDEFTLEFGTKEEKRNLLTSIKLTSRYRVMDDIVQRQMGDNSWEDVLLDSKFEDCEDFEKDE